MCSFKKDKKETVFNVYNTLTLPELYRISDTYEIFSNSFSRLLSTFNLG